MDKLTIPGMGWVPDLPDFRDLKAAAVLSLADPETLPDEHDLPSQYLPTPLDQSALGSCTANMAAAMVMYALSRESKSVFLPSRLFIYYNERNVEGTVGYDSGAQIRDALKVLNVYGAPPETDWPYDISQFAVKPPDACYTEGVLHEAVQYASVNQDETSMMAALAADYPIGVGISVYESFMAGASDGKIQMPLPTERLLGGHAVWVHGYQRNVYWKLRNSWGQSWGEAGDFYLPWAYLLDPNLADDFWSLQLVS